MKKQQNNQSQRPLKLDRTTVKPLVKLDDKELEAAGGAGILGHSTRTTF